MVRDFCEKLGFPEEAILCLDTAYRKMLQSPSALREIYAAMDKVYSAEPRESVAESLETVSKYSGVHRYTSDLVFWILCAKPLQYIYKQKNIPEPLYWDAIRDLKYKLMECHSVYGIWGVFTQWFDRFFTCQRMAFGRLQYDLYQWGGEDYRGILKKGDTCFYCHIPSSGPLTPESVMDSIKRLYEYHKDSLSDGILKIVTTTGLLYPPTIELYPEGSNTRKFYELFDIIAMKERATSVDFWRIFNMMYEGPETLDRVPLDTSLRRNYAAYLKAGNKMGAGTGVILFDGTKIL